jgi:(p)ppGpp synthase/HD superfamily hydrolase
MNRAEFFAKLEPFHAPSTLLDIELAYTLAKYGHRAQVRRELGNDGEPLRYFEHVRRVTLNLIDGMKITEPSMIIASLLHDGIEDTRDLTPAMIEHVFGADVVRLVKTLSKAPKEGYIDRFYQCSDWRPFIIKACDRLDNLGSIQDDAAFAAKQRKETREVYIPLFRYMMTMLPAGLMARAGVLVRDIELLSREDEL